MGLSVIGSSGYTWPKLQSLLQQAAANGAAAATPDPLTLAQAQNGATSSAASAGPAAAPISIVAGTSGVTPPFDRQTLQALLAVQANGAFAPTDPVPASFDPNAGLPSLQTTDQLGWPPLSTKGIAGTSDAAQDPLAMALAGAAALGGGAANSGLIAQLMQMQAQLIGVPAPQPLVTV
jgi:hypothetical protein